MSVVLSLVCGGGSRPVTDLAGGPVDAGAVVLDAAASLAAGDRPSPAGDRDVAGAVAFGAAAERRQIQPPTHRAVAVIGKILRQLQAWMMSAG